MKIGVPVIITPSVHKSKRMIVRDLVEGDARKPNGIGLMREDLAKLFVLAKLVKTQNQFIKEVIGDE